MLDFSGNRFCQRETPTYLKDQEKNSYILSIKEIELIRYEDLYAYKIVVPHGIKFAPHFDNDEKISKIYTKGYFQSVKMIVNARAEAITGAIDSLC